MCWHVKLNVSVSTPGTEEPDGIPARDAAPELAGGLAASQLQQRAVRGSMATAVHVLISVPISTLVSLLIARVLGPIDYGTLAYLSTASTVAVAVSELGVPTATLQWGAAASAAGRRREVESLLRGAAGHRLLIQSPLLLLFGWILLRGVPIAIPLWYIAATLITAVFAGPSLALALENRTASVAFLALATGIVVQGSVLILGITTKDPYAVWVGRLVVGSIFTIAGLAFVRRSDRRASLLPRLPTMPRAFWRFALLMCVAGALTLLIYSRSEVFVLRMYGSNKELGWFALAFSLSQLLTTPIDAMLGPLLPASAALLANHPSYVRNAMRRAIRYSALFSGVIVACGLPMLFFIVPFAFGSAYGPVAPMFLVLGATSVFQSIFHPVNAMLTARRRAGLIVAISGAALALDIGIALAVIPWLGAWGAVLANIVGQGVSIVMFARSELRFDDIDIRECVHCMEAFGLALPPAVLALAIGRLTLPLSPISAALSALVVGGAGYVAVLRHRGKVLSPTDAEVLVRAMPGRIAPHVRRVLGVLAQPRSSS